MALNIYAWDLDRFEDVIREVMGYNFRFMVYDSSNSVLLPGEFIPCSGLEAAKSLMKQKENPSLEMVSFSSVLNALHNWHSWSAQHLSPGEYGEIRVVDIGTMIPKYNTEIQQNIQSITQKNNNMKEDNLKFVSEQVKYGGGFSDGPLAEMKSNFEKGLKNSSVVFAKLHGKDTAESTLNFSLFEAADMHFWNNYKMAVKYADGSEKSETFQIDSKQSNKNIITENEAYKLIGGAAFLKEYKNSDQSLENKWTLLDDKAPAGKKKVLTYDEKHGYDLRGLLMRRPIKDKDKPGVIEGIASTMENGLPGKAIYIIDGGEEKMTLLPIPRYKALEETNSKGEKFSYQQNVIDSPSVKQPSEQQREGNGQSVKKDDEGEPSSSKKEGKAEAQNATTEKKSATKRAKKGKSM